MSKPVGTSASTQARAAICIVGLLSLVGAIVSPEPIAVLASGLCLALIMRLLWIRDELPILLLPAVFQWSEVAIWPLATIWKQVPLNELSEYQTDLNSAALYGLAAVAVLAVGLRLGSGRPTHASFAKRIRDEATTWRYRDISVVAFSAVGFGYLAAFLSAFGGPSRELFNELSNIKFVGLFVLTYWCLVRRSHPSILAAVVACEVVFGMSGFFADFKNSILTFVIAALAARPKLRPSHIASVAAAVALLIVVGIFWSDIKPSYRAFVNQGTGGQVVLEPLDRRLGFLAEAATTMDGERFSHGFNRLIARHGYIEFLAATMRYVPAGRPHENGQLTLDVLKHISVPRLFFPNKAVLPNDTVITSRYTGLRLVMGDGTSISIGYLGELYVDFGFIGSLVAVLAIGCLAGLAYRTLRDHGNRPVLLVAGLCLMVVLPLAYFGQPYSKTIGSGMFSVIVAFFAQRFWLPFVFRSRLSRSTRYFNPRISPRASSATAAR